METDKLPTTGETAKRLIEGWAADAQSNKLGLAVASTYPSLAKHLPWSIISVAVDGTRRCALPPREEMGVCITKSRPVLGPSPVGHQG